MRRIMATRYARVAAVALPLVALGACTEPGTVPKPPGLQGSFSNIRDWDASAIAMVSSMAAQGLIPGPPPPPAKPSATPRPVITPALYRQPFPPPYYVYVTQPGSAFLETAQQSIERELMMRGLPVVRSPDGATVLNLSADVVKWGSDVPYPGGVLTAVGVAGVVGTALAAGGPFSATGTAALAATGAAATDVAVSIYPKTRTELVWRVSIVDSNRVMMKGEDYLYASAADLPLYLGSGTLTAISSPGVSVLGAAWPLRYAR